MQSKPIPADLHPDFTVRAKVRILLREHWTVREIATLLELSTQAIYVHVRALEEQEEGASA